MNIFKQLYRSLYSPRDIATFRFQGIGKSILFIFVLTLISVIPTIYYVSTSITSGLAIAEETINTLPEFTIEDGELSSDANEPIIIEKDDFSIYFDSTGVITAEEIEETDNALAILNDEFVMSAGGTQDVLPYSTLTDFTLTKNDLTEMVSVFDGILYIMLPLLGLTIYIFSSGAKFIEVSVLALFGLLLKGLAKKNIPYRQLWRLSAYSVTLPTIFFTLMEAIKTNVPGAFLINWAVALVMLYLVLKEVPQKK